MNTQLNTRPFIPGIAYGRIRYWWESEESLHNTVVMLRNPSIPQVLSLKTKKPSAIVVIGIHRFSHVLIYLYTLGIPTVLIEQERGIPEGAWALIDGMRGTMQISKTRIAPREWDSMVTAIRDRDSKPSQHSYGAISTVDDLVVTLEASVNDIEGAAKAAQLGVPRIGLTRSEFCFEGWTSPPNVEDHKRVLEEILSVTGRCEIGIRLLDFGGGKIFSWMPDVASLEDSLGIRGCRAFRHDALRSLIDVQLEAIRDTNVDHRLNVLIPFVTSPTEYNEVHARVSHVLGNNTAISAMLETPAAAMAAKEIGRVSKQITIGTNDLLQCFFGVSREFPIVADLLDPYAPVFYRFMQQVANLQAETGPYFRICGHVPLLPYGVELLVALGYRCFSVEPLYISHVAARIERISVEGLCPIIKEAIESPDSDTLIRIMGQIKQ